MSYCCWLIPVPVHRFNHHFFKYLPVVLNSSSSLIEPHSNPNKYYTWMPDITVYSIQFSWFAQSCPTLCNPMDCSMPDSLSITNSQSLLKFMSIESVMPSNHLILCHLLLLLPSVFPSIGVFSSESVLQIKWPKYWSFSFSINPSNEYPGLFSFRMDWLDLLAVQETLKSLLQHHSSKASILCLAVYSIYVILLDPNPNWVFIL